MSSQLRDLSRNRAALCVARVVGTSSLATGAVAAMVTAPNATASLTAIAFLLGSFGAILLVGPIALGAFVGMQLADREADGHFALSASERIRWLFALAVAYIIGMAFRIPSVPTKFFDHVSALDLGVSIALLVTACCVVNFAVSAQFVSWCYACGLLSLRAQRGELPNLGTTDQTQYER